MSVERIDQGMAGLAVRTLPEPGAVTKELRTRYRQLQAMLHNAGLAATYAYIASKARTGPKAKELEKAYAAAERAIAERIFGDDAPGTPGEVLSRLSEMSAVEYARASAQAAAFVGWLSRLADAARRDADDSGDDGSSEAGEGDDA
jgi:CRISPR type III-B/RAMP module-associated protein Cmr5